MKTLFARRSLQARLLLLVLGVAALVWSCAALLTWVDARHELDELLDGHLAQAAGILVIQADGDDDDIGETPVLHKYATLVAYQVYIDGQLTTRTKNAPLQPMSPQPDGFATVEMAQGQQWRVFGTYVAARRVQVYVGEKLESRQTILWAVLRSVLWPLVFGLPILAVSAWWAVRRGLAPLRQFSHTLRQRPADAMEPVVFYDLPPELRPLTDALNALLLRIADMMASERRFTADAAHELRTPIAAIRAQAQVALRAGDNVDQRTHALQLTLAGCDRATRLVEQLLTLARLEAPAGLTAVASDLAQVTRRVLAELTPAALAKGQHLELDAMEGCTVAGDDVLLSVLVRNLVDNALRYSPPNAKVLVRVARNLEGVDLVVQDSGPGMLDVAMARLGERFFRVLGSDQPGSGLGWSIVRRLTEKFGAHTLIAPSVALGGLSVTVRWPA